MTTETIIIDTRPVQALRGEFAPLFNRYPGQTGAQPAFIEMTEDGDVSADYSGEIGNAVPMHVWHGRTLRWSVPAAVKGEALADFIEQPDVYELLGRIHAGHSVEWDGSNHVGQLDEDAQSASDELERLIESELDDGATVETWDTEEWLFSSAALIDCWPSDTDLDEAAANLESDAQSDNVLLINDVRETLLKRALDDFVDHPELLAPNQVAALLEAEMIDQDEFDDWQAERDAD